MCASRAMAGTMMDIYGVDRTQEHGLTEFARIENRQSYLSGSAARRLTSANIVRQSRRRRAAAVTLWRCIFVSSRIGLDLAPANRGSCGQPTVVWLSASHSCDSDSVLGKAHHACCRYEYYSLETGSGLGDLWPVSFHSKSSLFGTDTSISRSDFDAQHLVGHGRRCAALNCHAQRRRSPRRALPEAEVR